MVPLRAAILCAVFFANVVFCYPVQAKVEFNQETINRLDVLVSSKISWSGDSPAYSILIDQGGEIVYERNIGYADIGNHVPATRNTVYKIGSITKSYTALAVLQLVEKGEIDLDANVSTYLKDYEGPAGNVTVRNLLTHTSGIPNYTALPEAREKLSWAVTTREDIVDLFKDKPLEFEPGSNFSYSNSGYYLLGLIVEAVSGSDYYDYIKTNVFESFDLKATFTGDYAEIVPQQARGYTVTPEGFANADPTLKLAPFSAGSLDASAADLIKYRRAVFKSESISQELREMVTQTSAFPGGIQMRYALGALLVSDFHGHRRWGHSGGISGFGSYHAYFPDDDITLVVLVNANGAPISPGNLAVKMAREIFMVPQPGDSEVEVSEQVLESYVGKYSMSPFRLFGEFARIVLKDGVLQLQANDDDENPSLIPLSARAVNEFVLAMGDELRIRFISETGQVTGLELLTSGGAMPASKIPATQP